jgi:integrase
MSLTAKQCDNAKPNNPGPNASPKKMFDGGGLYLLIRPNGTKLWQLAYRVDGKPKTASFGEYHSDPMKGVTLAMAREARDRIKVQLRQGVDPMQARRDAVIDKLGRKTFKDVTTAWLELIAKKPRADKTRDRDERLTNYLINTFGDKSMQEITALDLTKLLDRFESEAAYETRMRVQAVAIRIAKFATGRQWIDRSPFADANFNDAYTSPVNVPRAAIIEPAEFGELLQDIAAYSGRNGNLVGMALQLLAMTFVRPGTVAGAEWTEVDLDAALWTIPAYKLKQRTFREVTELRGKPHHVPLSRQAVALLRKLKEQTGWSKYLFPGREGSRSMSADALEVALKSLGYRDVHSPHGFRSSASTMLNRERVSVNGTEMPRFAEQVIEFQLEHIDASIAAIYNRDERLPERITLMQVWSDRLDDLRNGKKSPPKLRVVA